MSIFLVDATGARTEGPMVVQMCGGIASVDCRNVDQALLWANRRNRQPAIDRYFAP